MRIYSHGFLSLIVINCDACVFWQKNIKKCFCVLHTANTLTCFFNVLKKTNIWTFKNVFSHGFLKHNKKVIFLHFWILQHVWKTPKGIGQYSKKYKNLILGGNSFIMANISKNTKILFLGVIHLLFTVNVWIKKS